METSYQFNYPKICLDLINNLPQRSKEVILRRFALKPKMTKKESLESIGKDYGITRERVRQIEKSAISNIKPKLNKYEEVFKCFESHLKNKGGVRREDKLVSELAGSFKFQNYVFFLLDSEDRFERFAESEEFYSFWTINVNYVEQIREIINSFYNRLIEANRPLLLDECELLPEHQAPVDFSVLHSWLEISKKIQQNQENFFGLKNWPEINPRTIKDKAYLVLKKQGNPLHFREVAEKISQLFSISVLVPSVHNELISDEKFVLVGKGIYGLREWGYKPGVVRDLILEILKDTNQPLSREEIIEEILKQRLVKKNTILQNLNDKKIFLKDFQGKYILKRTYLKS